MSPSSPNSDLQLHKRFSRWLPLLSLAMAMAVLPLAAVASDVPVASCDAAEGQREPVQSRMFAENTLYLIEKALRERENWLALHKAALCHDAQALAYLDSQVDTGSASMYALSALIDAGVRDATELPAAIGRAGLSSEVSMNLLTIAYGWIVATRAQMLPSVAVAETEWAVQSEDPDLAQAGWDMRAVFQDPVAIERRAKRLTDCATGIGTAELSFSGCVGSNERFTASTSTLVQRWANASPVEREWLTVWAQPNEASQEFLLEQILDEPPGVQYAILTKALTTIGGNPELAIQGALALLQQALDEPTRRPEAVMIDFTNDYAEGDFGVSAYEGEGRYPLVFQAAFEELTTYPDATALMNQLAALEHPWLATHAGIWLMRHDVANTGRNGLRFTLEDDGLPSRRVLGKLDRSIDSGVVPASMRTLFEEALDHGAMGKWNAFANDDFEPLLSEPKVAERVLKRISDAPTQLEQLVAQFSPKAPLPAQSKEVPGLADEVRAAEWAIKWFNKTNADAVDACIDTYAARHEDIWRAYALTVAKETGRDQRARELALTLVDSKWPSLAEGANEVLKSTPAE